MLSTSASVEPNRWQGVENIPKGKSMETAEAVVEWRATHRFFCFHRQLLLVFHLEQNICRHFRNQILKLLYPKGSGDRGAFLSQ